LGLAGGLNVYGFASGDPVDFSDPFGLCPFDDQKRSTDLSDCDQKDKRLPAFKLLAKNALGRSFIKAFVDNKIERKLVAGAFKCGNTNAKAVQKERISPSTVQGTPWMSQLQLCMRLSMSWIPQCQITKQQVSHTTRRLHLVPSSHF